MRGLWDPSLLERYGLRPWELADFTPRELRLLEAHGRGPEEVG